MAAVNEAYRVLSDPGRRVVYDRSLGEVAPTGGACGPPSAVDPETRSATGADAAEPAGARRPGAGAMADDGGRAVIGSAAVLVSSIFDDPAATAKPDGIIQPGSCVEFEVNGDAREVVCGSADDIVVQSLVPLDAVCPAGTVAHRDRLGLGIACVA